MRAAIFVLILGLASGALAGRARGAPAVPDSRCPNAQAPTVDWSAGVAGLCVPFERKPVPPATDGVDYDAADAFNCKVYLPSAPGAPIVTWAAVKAGTYNTA